MELIRGREVRHLLTTERRPVVLYRFHYATVREVFQCNKSPPFLWGVDRNFFVRRYNTRRRVRSVSRLSTSVEIPGLPTGGHSLTSGVGVLVSLYLRRLVVQSLGPSPKKGSTQRSTLESGHSGTNVRSLWDSFLGLLQHGSGDWVP